MTGWIFSLWGFLVIFNVCDDESNTKGWERVYWIWSGATESGVCTFLAHACFSLSPPRAVLIGGEACFHWTNRLSANLDLDCFIFSPKSLHVVQHLIFRRVWGWGRMKQTHVTPSTHDLLSMKFKKKKGGGVGLNDDKPFQEMKANLFLLPNGFWAFLPCTAHSHCGCFSRKGSHIVVEGDSQKQMRAHLLSFPGNRYPLVFLSLLRKEPRAITDSLWQHAADHYQFSCNLMLDQESVHVPQWRVMPLHRSWADPSSAKILW